MQADVRSVQAPLWALHEVASLRKPVGSPAARPMTAATATVVSVRIPDARPDGSSRASSPGIASVRPAQHGAGEQPSRSEPTVTAPRVAEPRVAEPRVAEPRVAEPRPAAPRQPAVGKRSVRAGGRSAAAGVPMVAGPISSLARSKLADAGRVLDRSLQAQDAAERYASAHLSALRGAAALVSSRPAPTSRNFKNASVWVLLAKVAPELEDWAGYFAAGSAKRKAAEAGISRLISDADAAEMVRRAADFLSVIQEAMAA